MKVVSLCVVVLAAVMVVVMATIITAINYQQEADECEFVTQQRVLLTEQTAALSALAPAQVDIAVARKTIEADLLALGYVVKTTDVQQKSDKGSTRDLYAAQILDTCVQIDACTRRVNAAHAAASTLLRELTSGNYAEQLTKIGEIKVIVGAGRRDVIKLRQHIATLQRISALAPRGT